MAQIYNAYPRKKSIFNLNINLLLLIINIVCYIVFSALIYFNNNLLDYIALKPSNILQGKYLWTFLTSIFMHGGFFHLFVNMFSLMFIGNLAEKILGKRRFFIFYLLSGLFAGISFVASSFLFSSDFNTYAVGASGALFGIIGFFMVITPNLPVSIMFIPIPIKMKFAAPIMLLLLWLISILGNVPVGNTAHLGGFIAGLAYGLYLKNKYKNKTKYISRYFS